MFCLAKKFSDHKWIHTITLGFFSSGKRVVSSPDMMIVQEEAFSDNFPEMVGSLRVRYLEGFVSH